jgi:cation transport ATPase
MDRIRRTAVEHPLAHAILKAARDKQVTLLPVENLP